MVQKFHIWVYTSQDGKQGFEERCIPSHMQQHYSQKLKVEATPGSTEGWVEEQKVVDP